MSRLTLESLLSLFGDGRRPVGIKELMVRGGLHPGQKTALKRLLRELLQTGQATQDGKRYQRAEALAAPHAPSRSPVGRKSADASRVETHRSESSDLLRVN